MATAPKPLKGKPVGSSRTHTKRPPIGAVRIPTEMQRKAVEYMAQGMKAGPALRKAGYAESVAKSPKDKFFARPSVQELMWRHRREFEKQGIDPKFIAKKMKEWLTATKIDHSPSEMDREVPDYSTQINAYKEYKKDIGYTSPNVAIQQNNQYNIGSLYDEFGVKEGDAEGV